MTDISLFESIFPQLYNSSPFWASTIGWMSYCPNAAFLNNYWLTPTNLKLFTGRLLHKAFHRWNYLWLEDIWDRGDVSSETLSQNLDTAADLVFENLEQVEDIPLDFLRLIHNEFYALFCTFGTWIIENLITEESFTPQEIVNQVFGGTPHFEERISLFENQIVVKPDLYAIHNNQAAVWELKLSDTFLQVAKTQAILTAMVIQTFYSVSIQNVRILTPESIHSVEYSPTTINEVIQLISKYITTKGFNPSFFHSEECINCVHTERCRLLVELEETRCQQMIWDQAFHSLSFDPSNLPEKLMTSKELQSRN